MPRWLAASGVAESALPDTASSDVSARVISPCVYHVCGMEAISPCLLEPRSLAELALVAVAQEVYVQGVATRRGAWMPGYRRGTGSKSQAPLICGAMDIAVARASAAATQRGGVSQRLARCDQCESPRPRAGDRASDGDCHWPQRPEQSARSPLLSSLAKLLGLGILERNGMTIWRGHFIRENWWVALLTLAAALAGLYATAALIP